MSKKVFYTKLKNDPLKVDIDAMPEWENFDDLVEYVLKFYNAKIITNVEGPDARRCIFLTGKITFELIHDDMVGNYFLAPTLESESIVYAIGKDLEKRFESSS